MPELRGGEITKGKLVTFIGIDGSGKTTLAIGLSKFLKESGIDIRYVHGRTSLIFSKPLVIMGNKIFLSDSNIPNDYSNRTIKKKYLFEKHKILKKIYSFILLFDIIIQLILKVKIPLLFKRNIVCDRYFYDSIITDMAVDMNYSVDEVIFLIKSCHRFLPEPNLTFIVDVTEENAYKRKKDISSIEYLRNRRNIYLEITRDYKMHVLNGNLNFDEVLQDCIRRAKSEFEL